MRSRIRAQVFHFLWRFETRRKGMAIIMKHKTALARLSAFLLSAALLSTSCGGGTTAATMHLRKTEGSVEVSDGQDKNITLMDNLGNVLVLAV